MAAAVEISGVSKSFKLHREKFTSLKERVLHFNRNQYEEFWALRDIDLTVEPGESLGLLGHNGSGKSTLLKCMAGILQPTFGTITTVGRMAALLELGAGFHPDLTGRENVFLNAAILGMQRREIERRLDDIVGFAELEDFIDTQVKFYSSGMYVRLGFAVAINMDPEVLLIDEVLAVGDESFQRKCIDKVRTFQREGRTIIVVTHAADVVRQICSRAAALDHGLLVSEGDPGTVIRVFREHLMSRGRTTPDDLAEQELTEDERRRSSPHWGVIRITDVDVTTADGSAFVETGAGVRIDVTLESERPVDDPVVGLAIYHPNGYMIWGTNTEIAGRDLGRVEGTSRISFSFDQIPLLDATYALTIAVHDRGGLNYDWKEQNWTFEVMSPGREVGMVSIPVGIELSTGL